MIGGMWNIDEMKWGIKVKLQATCHSTRIAKIRESHTWVYECRREKSWYMSYSYHCLSTLIHMAFAFYKFFFFNYLVLYGITTWCVGCSSEYLLYVGKFITHSWLGQSWVPKWCKGPIWGALGTRVIAMMKWVELMFGFFPCAKYVCLNHLFPFMVNFLLRVAK